MHIELLLDAGMLNGKCSHTPMEQNIKFTTPEYDKLFGQNVIDSLHRDSEVYRRIVERLLYLTMTRPDIAYLVQHLSQFVHAAKKSHMDAAMRVL